MRFPAVVLSALVLVLFVSVVRAQEQQVPDQEVQDQQAPEQQQPLLDAGHLDQLVAPIALYPDPLLAQVLMASTYPLEVVQADRFAKANKIAIGRQAHRRA